MTDKRQEQIAFPNQGTTYYTEPRPARKIPTREQILTAARRQALLEERGTQQSSKHHIGSSAGFHPEEDENEYDDVWPPRMPTSSRRYQHIPDVTTTKGRVDIVEHYHDQPLRTHRTNYQQLPPQRERYTDEVETPVPKSKGRKRCAHPLLYLGVGMIAMLALFVLLFSAATWLQEKQNDLRYGRPRTFQIDFVVGHNDSSANPSHFIAVNLNRHVQVIEIPGQDSSKERTFPITTLYGDGEDLTVRRVGAC